METDADRIRALGGPTKLARMLGTSPQRVCNWATRGIPAKVKLERPELFLWPIDEMKRKREAVGV